MFSRTKLQRTPVTYTEILRSCVANYSVNSPSSVQYDIHLCRHVEFRSFSLWWIVCRHFQWRIKFHRNRRLFTEFRFGVLGNKSRQRFTCFHILIKKATRTPVWFKRFLRSHSSKSALDLICTRVRKINWQNEKRIKRMLCVSHFCWDTPPVLRCRQICVTFGTNCTRPYILR